MFELFVSIWLPYPYELQDNHCGTSYTLFERRRAQSSAQFGFGGQPISSNSTATAIAAAAAAARQTGQQLATFNRVHTNTSTSKTREQTTLAGARIMYH